MVNVISFCLYGPYNPKYYNGLKENIEIIFDKLPLFHIHVWIVIKKKLMNYYLNLIKTK